MKTETIIRYDCATETESVITVAQFSEEIKEAGWCPSIALAVLRIGQYVSNTIAAYRLAPEVQS